MKTKKIHYCYKITNLKPSDKRLYYIGVRSTKLSNPELDTNYRSSSKYLKEAIKEIGHNNFKKEILSTWETRKLANQEEIRLHEKFDVAKNPLFYNKSKALANGFCTEGQVTVIDTRDNETKNVSQEDFVKFSFYKSISKDTVVVTDLRNNTRKRVSTQDYKKNDYFKVCSSGFVIVVDKNEKISRITIEEFNSNLETFKIHTTGKLPVIDTRNNTKKMVSLEDFRNNDFYITFLKGKMLVLDLEDNMKKMIDKEIVKNNKRYVNIHIGMMTVIDTRDNLAKRVSKEDYHKFEYYVNTNSTKINIFDKKGKLMFETFGNFENICKLNNLPFGALKQSIKNNGSPIYSNLRKQQISRIKKLNYFHLKGWYALKISK